MAVLAEVAAPARPLPEVPAGVGLRVRQVAAGDADGCRLRELGLYEGAHVKVLTQGDPVVLMVFGNRFAVCRRCARHVDVEILD